MTLPVIRYGDVMESTPQLLWHADQSRRLWDSVLPKIWSTPENIDKPFCIPIHARRS